ncbi:MAG: JAB domain-containing protein [Candidatus Falkowbacteria bacterium]
MNRRKKKPATPPSRLKRPCSSGQILKTARKNRTVFLVAPRDRLIAPAEAVRLARKLVTDPYKEHFIAIYLSARNDVVKTELVSLGTLNASIVHPREVFRPAIMSRACAIIVLHNHPSGDVSPSESDLELTKRLKNAGQLLGIEVLDHVIFEKGDRFYSFENKKRDDNA